MNRRRAVSLFVLAFAAACESPATAPNRSSPGNPLLTVQAAEPAHSCTGLEYDGTFTDVVVPAGESCILAFGTVSGSVTVMDGASLYSVDTRVGGNVVTRNPASVELSGTVIDGDVVVEGNVGGPRRPEVRLAGATLTRGDVRVTGNARMSVNVRDSDILQGTVWVQNNVDSFITVIASRVGRAIHVVNNGGDASTTVRSSTAGLVIRCEANTGGFNAAENEAPVVQGQCRGY